MFAKIKLQMQYLSEREKEIVQFISEGYTDNEIASQLMLSPKTVNTHRKNILRKLNLKNTALLIRFAFENNLIR